jgi:thiamine-phosphate pyrophosphorylase
MEGAIDAAEAGADYLFFGPVFETPSKAPFGPPQGLVKLRQVCSAVSIPVIAIGGITLENARACRETGAAGIAAIRLFQQDGDVAKIVADLTSK